MALFAALAALVAPAVASAQAEQNQVIVVPFSQSNLALPHPAHVGAHMTLKGIVRNAQCGSYDVTWDVNRNDRFDDDFTRRVSREGNSLTVRDIGRTFRVPDPTPGEDRDASFNINVQVVPTCAGQEAKFGTFRLFVYDYTLSPDPVAWTEEQFQLAGQMALQEVMWFLHRSLNNIRNRDRNDIYGYFSGCGSYCRETEATALWLMAVNGHLPALPPGTINTFGRPLPDGWREANERRWETDPYAETTMRMMNDAVLYGSGTKGINRADEDTRCEFNPDGTERRCNRIAGTDDGRGAWFAQAGTRGTHQRVYAMGIYGGAMAIGLPSLGGTPVQVGADGVRGTNWEFYIQQAADYLGAMQIDGSSALGCWYYYETDGGRSNSYCDGSTNAWAYIALESSEIAGAPFNVYVPSRIKYRIANAMISNQRGDGATGYRSTSGRGSFQLTGGAFVAHRWMGVHRFNRGDGAVAFPGYSGYTRDRLRRSYDTYLQYTANAWTRQNGTGSIGWQDRLYQRGDYLCGNRNAVYMGPYNRNNNGVTGSPGGGGCANMYAIYNMQKGFRTGAPELTRVGNHDWNREFTTYVARAQERGLNPNNPVANYSVFGQIRDTFCESHSVTCAYAPGFLSAGMAGLVLTPTIFAPPPIAIGSVDPPEVTEGCAGDNDGRVTFTHSNSFHPSPSAEIRFWRWDVDAENGLWWELGLPPDFVTQDRGVGTFEHVYERAGIYTATLQVVDNADPAQAKTATVQVTVNESANRPPSGSAGAAYIITVGQNLQLRGSAQDQDLDCGDNIVAAWDIDNDRQFDDAQGPTALVPWARLQNLPVGVPNPIRMRVVDDAGEEAIFETTVTIFQAEPVAVARVQPNPAACEQNIQFDASGSFHPNPDRIVSQYIWDINGDGQPDSGQRTFTRAYDQYGQYNVSLVVVDDDGNVSDPVQVAVDVSLGNAPPVARVSQDEYIVIDGDQLVLDARASSDPNARCGDSIESFAWDLDGDGQFDDAVGPNPSLDFNQLAAIVNWPAAANNGRLELQARVRLTDEFGESGFADFTIVIIAGRPVAVVVQRPDPAPINLVTGESNPTLDGRESFSQVDGAEIVRWEWDLDNNGTFEVQNEAAVVFRKNFNPVPGPNNIPRTVVRLRVRDSEGRVSLPVEYEVRYDVPPTAPTADADPSPPPETGYHILVGENVTLDGSESFDPDSDEFGDILKRYAWDLTYDEDDGFNADVATVGQNGQPADPRIAVTWNELRAAGVNAPGEFPIALEVVDSTDLSNLDTSVIHVYAVEPVVDIDANPNPAACGGRVTFDGRGSDHPHPDIDVVSHMWDLDGDGQFDDGDQALVDRAYDQFTFNQPIRIGLQIEDSRGTVTQGFVDLDVTEGNRPPDAVAGGFRDGNGRVVGPYAIARGESVQLDATGSSDPDVACGDAIVSYEWDLNGDGQPDAQGLRPPVITQARMAQLNIDRVGNHTVTLTVTDRFGVESRSDVVLRIVNGPTALATANPERTGCNQQVIFDGSRSSTDGPVDQGFAIVDYAWDFDGDGQFDDANEPRVTRPVVALPDENGRIVQTARLRVTDEAGRTAIDDISVVIDVQNNPPVANAGGPYVTGQLQNGDFAPIRLDGRGSLDPNAPCDAIAVYKWDTNNDGLYGDDPGANDLTGATANYVGPNWRPNTVSNVRLIVCDNFGACSPPSEAEIIIGDTPPPAGEIISPRADDPNTCINADVFTVVVDVTHPEGSNVTATVIIAAGERGSLRRNVPAGQTVRYEIPIDPENIPEGRQEIIVHLESDAGAEAQIDAGGLVIFDTTPPQVNIVGQLGEGICYNENAVPDAQVNTDDNFDPAPALVEETVQDGCGRTLRVTATDFCGNVGVGERNYLIAEPVELAFNGVEDGGLYANTRVTWEVVGPDTCAANIDAQLSRDGGGEVPYNENDLINQPGDYALRMILSNCQGVVNEQIVGFAINRPPVAVPVTANHPQRDAAAPANPFGSFGYVVNEGDVLEVDASDSRAPEAAEFDQIDEFAWDFDNDGNFDDGIGVRVPFNTDDDNTYTARLRVTDSIGAASVQAFRVVVNDVDPIADPGGNGRYIVDQGAEFRPDGSGSRAGSPADPIQSYVWDWGDGTPNGNGVQPVHTFAANGVYNVRLTVNDEDSSDTAVVVVEVRDVDPEIDGITVPDELVELNTRRFIARVEPGAPGDPITRYEWDFDGDGVADYAGPNLVEVEHVFRDPGDYTVRLIVRDEDSAAVFDLPVQVREMTLAEVIAWKDTEVTRREDAGELDVPQRFALRNFNDQADRGLFGERNRRRGNTMLALDRMLIGMVDAHNDAADADGAFGLQLWAVSRQLLRETRRQRAAILNDDNGPGENADAMRRGLSYLEQMEDIFEADDFEARLLNGGNASDVQQLHAAAIEAYYWHTESVSPCNLVDLSIDPNLDAVQRTIEANDNNDDLTPVLADIAADMTSYTGHEAGAGPGVAEVTAAINDLNFIRNLQTQDVGVDCDGRNDLECINDIDALRLELRAMDLADALDVAASRGVWVRGWQSCMVNTVNFRIELSITRLAFVCGLFNRHYLQAREKQAIGQYLIEEEGCALNDAQGRALREGPVAAAACQNANPGDDCTFGEVDGMRIDGKCVADDGGALCEPRLCSDPAALDYYKDEDTRCFLIEAYNECLVAALGDINDPYPADPNIDFVPAACAPEDE